MVTSRSEKRRLLREQLWNVLHFGFGRGGHIFNLLLLLCIIVSVAILPLHFLLSNPSYLQILFTVDLVITTFFTAEYLLRVFVAPRRMKFIFSFFGIIDLLSILPFFCGVVWGQYALILRSLRIFQLFKLGEYRAAAASSNSDQTKRRIGLLEGEKVEFIISMHPLYLILGCLPPLASTSAAVAIFTAFLGYPVAVVASACLLFFSLLFLWKTWLDFGYDVVFVTNRRLIVQNQFFFGRSNNQINYHTITNVSPVFPSFLAYLLSYGTVKIETNAAEKGHIELNMVRNHEQAAHAIMEKCYTVGKSTAPYSPTSTHSKA